MVQEFMAENFEYISRCQIFLLLSSKALHEILSDRNLKADTEDNLAKSILKWVSHEPCGNNAGTSCAGDILEVRDTNIVSDRRLDHSADVINGPTGSVEVILQAPPASSQDSCRQIVVQFLTETPAARKESLGTLLKLSRLSEASRDCVEMLAGTDMIMGVKETRDVVKQALAAHSTAQESVQNTVLPTNSVAPADDLSLTTEHVVVFMKAWKMCAYSLTRNKFFNIMPGLYFYQVGNYYTFNNCIFITDILKYRMEMTVYQFPFSKNSTTVIKGVGYCSAIVSGFCYTFKGYGFYRMRCDDKHCDWFRVTSFKRKTNCVLVDIFKDNVIFYDTKSDKKRINCFDTTTHRVWDIMTVEEMYGFVTFIHNDQLYVLTHEGYLWNMTASVDPPTTHLCDAGVTDGRVQQKHHKLWDGRYDLTGAVICADTLVIFAYLHSCKTSVITIDNLIQGVFTIHFVHLDTVDKCHSLIVPSELLVTEI